MTDPYKILGVPKNATQDDIKKAYRKLAKELHPDLHPGDGKIEERFKRVSAAYALLSDPENRARYDRGEIDGSGQARAEQQFYRTYAGGAAGGGGAPGGMEDFFSDLFGDLGGFGGGSSHGRARERGHGRTNVHMRGQDITYNITIDFLDAATGAKKRITMPDGRSLDVTVPEGIADGQSIRLKRQGGKGIGEGQAGDALIHISVAPHDQFVRKGADIHSELPISLPEAVLGAKVDVPTVHGMVTMSVPKGSSSGDALRLKGKGVRDSKTKRRGDQYVKLRVVLPKPPDAELSAFVERWAKTKSYDVR